MLIGLEDGSLHLYNLTKNFGKSHLKPQGTNLKDPYHHFVESNFEHQDAIVSVEKTSNNCILTASRDGAIMLWTVEPNQMEGDDMLRFVADQQIREPLTKVKFISDSQILASTVQGNLFLAEIRKDSQNVPFLDKPKLFFQTDSAIWDFGVFHLTTDSPQQVVIAQDSGRVTQLCTKSKETSVLTVRFLSD